MTPRNLVLVCDGLGNQMFQYAFYLFLKNKYPKTTYDCSLALKDKAHYGYELDKLFGIPAQTENKLLLFFIRLYARFFLIRKKTSDIFNYAFISDYAMGEMKNFTLKKYNVFNGWWHTSNYFKTPEQEKLIRHIFTFKMEPSEKTKKVQAIMENNNSIAIHIRRGDYLSDTHRKRYENICTISYYKNAIQYFWDMDNECQFFFFSDDLEWVKENIHVPNAHYIDINNGKDSWQDMYLMSKCKHNIIANSTFSWWGAWLNGNPHKIIICPSKFDNEGHGSDLFLENWIHL